MTITHKGDSAPDTVIQAQGINKQKKKRRPIFRCLGLLLLKGQASYLNVQDQEVRGSLGSPVILRIKQCSCFDRNAEVQTVNRHVWTWSKGQPEMSAGVSGSRIPVKVWMWVWMRSVH